MPQATPSSYLESKVKTASTAQLHLMLIEGALRFCTKAQLELEKNNEGHANDAMLRAMDIVGEMLAGVRGGQSEINQKLVELYQYLFYTLTSAYVNTDATKLGDVMRILEFERETWQLACERVQTEQGDKVQPKPSSTPIVAPHVSQPSASQGVSFEV